MDVADSPGRDELGEVRDEIRGAPQGRVLFEIRVVGSVVQDLASGAVVGELLQRQGSPCDVLPQGLSGRMDIWGCGHDIQGHGLVDAYASLLDWVSYEIRALPIPASLSMKCEEAESPARFLREEGFPWSSK